MLISEIKITFTNGDIESAWIDAEGGGCMEDVIVCMTNRWNNKLDEEIYYNILPWRGLVYTHDDQTYYNLEHIRKIEWTGNKKEI